MAYQMQAGDEAEELRRAICNGEVDGFVVGSAMERERVLLLSGSHERYRHVVEDIEQGAVTLSGSGEILFSNHSFAAMLGARQPVELLGSTLQSHASAADAAQVAALLRPRAGQPDLDVALAKADGATVSVRLSLVSASDGFITLLVTDLARQALLDDAARTVEAIRQGEVDAFVIGEERVGVLDGADTPYRVLVERMRQGAVTVAPGGMISYANARFADMVGRPRERLVGTALAALVAAADGEELRSMLRAEEAAQGELALRCASGERLPTRASMTRLDGHCMFLFSDASERKRHLAADQRTRDFLGVLAREFRDMLAGIGDSAHALKNLAHFPEEGREHLHVIERQTARLRGLADDLARINPKD